MTVNPANITVDLTTYKKGRDGKYRGDDPNGLKGAPPVITALNFNDPASAGQVFTDWTWYSDVTGYGQPGWQNNAESPTVHSAKGRWYRIFNKSGESLSSGYGQTQNDPAIDSTVKAPQRSSGGSLLISESSSLGRCGAWVWYDGEAVIDRLGILAKHNRCSTYVLTHGYDDFPKTGLENDIGGGNFHWATYLGWTGTGSAYGTGDGLPYEGPGNQHYYHYFNLPPDYWCHLQLDQRPRWRRNAGDYSNYNYAAGGAQLTNPPLWGSGLNYMQQLIEWYCENRYTASSSGQSSSLNFDNFEFWSTSDSVQPIQNETSIAGVAVGKHVTSDNWFISFYDTTALAPTPNSSVVSDAAPQISMDYTTNTTFEVRWSPNPITEANWENAQSVIFDANSYAGVAYAGAENKLKRFNPWDAMVFSRFTLPPGTEAANSIIYFAIKDVSVKGGNIGTQSPYNNPSGDFRDAEPGIKLIDYVLRSA